MRALALALLLGCSMSKSAERQDSFGQEVESRRDEGPVRVVETVEDFGDGTGPGATLAVSPAQRESPAGTSTGEGACARTCPPLIRRTVTVTERAPVVTTTKTQTDASGEAHTASAQRFGFSPWQWAIGGLVLLAGLYGAFWVKRKLAI